MSQSPTKQLDTADSRAEDDYGQWSLDLKSNAFEGAMNEISTGFESERAAYEREFLSKFRELRRPVTKEIIDAVNSGRAAVEVVNEFFDKAIVEVMDFMHGRRQLEDSLHGRLMHATHHVFDRGIDDMLRRDREKKAFLKQSFETRIEESRISSKVELSNSTLVLEAKFERQLFDVKERARRDAEAMSAALRSKDEDMRVAQAQFNSKLAAEKAGAKHFADQLRTDLESTKAQLEFLRKSTASTSSAKSVLEAERKALSDEMTRLTTLHKEERQRNELQMHKLRTELDDVKASQAAERKKIKETTEQASKQLEMAHDQLRSMQFELQAMQQRVDVSSVRLAESEGSLKDLYGRYRESQSILSETLSSKEEYEKASLLAQDTIMELTRDKDELATALQDSKEQLAAGEVKLAEIQSELEGVLKAQERNRKKLLDSEMRVTVITADMNAAKSRQKELEDEASALREEIESLKIALDAALHNGSSQSSSLAQQLQDMQANIDDARAVRELDKEGADELIASLRSRIALLENAQKQPVEPVQAHGAQTTTDSIPALRPAANAASQPHVIPAPKPASAPPPPAAAAAPTAADGEALNQHTHDTSVESASVSSNGNEEDLPAEQESRLEINDATNNSSVTTTRIKGRTPDSSSLESSRLPTAASHPSNPASRESQPKSAASGKSSAAARSPGPPQSSAHVAAAPQPASQHSRNSRARSSSREGQRLTTASSAVSTSSGLSIVGMSGVEAASVFMEDASKTLFIDSASEATPPHTSDPPSTAEPSALLNGLIRIVSEYGFDAESSAFIAASLMRQQASFTLKMTQQRQAFEACIESFKSSAAAQMQLQLVQLSKAHENESVQAAKALNDNKKIVLELKKKNVELSARISQMETQALHLRGADAGTGNLGELQTKLEHAGLQMQAYLNVIEEQRAQISVFLNALKSVGGATDGEMELFKGGSKAMSSVKELKLVLPSAAKTSLQLNTKNMHATYSVLKRSKSSTPSGLNEPGGGAAGMLPSIRQ